MQDIEKTLETFYRQIDKLILQLKSLEHICEPPIVLNPPSQYEIDLMNYKPEKKSVKIFEILSTEILNDSDESLSTAD
jgi:hypothetical protein